MLNKKLLNYVLELSKEQIVILPAEKLQGKHYPPFFSNQNVLITLDQQEEEAVQEILPLLLKIYPKEQPFILFQTEAGSNEIPSHKEYSIEEAVQRKDLADTAAIYIPALEGKNSALDFLELIAHLRAPEGCPWDRKQTHQSLRPNLLEETYEVLYTIDENDMTGLQEELGDLLLQIVLHAQISGEQGDFNFEDVVTGIEQKLIYRHPHVFGEGTASDSEEVIKNWEVLKAKERKEHHKSDRLLRSVPKIMSALSLAQAYQKRAARVGFDWETIEQVKKKVSEELEEVESAANDDERAKELGDVLFTVVNLIRWYGCDAESVLREAAERFAGRFEYIEDCIKQRGKTFADFTLAELDQFWEDAKKK